MTYLLKLLVDRDRLEVMRRVLGAAAGEDHEAYGALHVLEDAVRGMAEGDEIVARLYWAPEEALAAWRACLGDGGVMAGQVADEISSTLRAHWLVDPETDAGRAYELIARENEDG